jgi:hypothetical protein
MERSNRSLTYLEKEIMAIVTIRIDLSKNVITVHSVDKTGNTVRKIVTLNTINSVAARARIHWATALKHT